MKQYKTIQLQLKPEIEDRLITQATKQGGSCVSFMVIED